MNYILLIRLRPLPVRAQQPGLVLALVYHPAENLPAKTGHFVLSILRKLDLRTAEIRGFTERPAVKFRSQFAE